MNTSSKPTPSPTTATEPFWSGCSQKKLLLRCCMACGALNSPTRYVCRCGSADLGWTPSSGIGTVYSFTILHRAPDPSFKEDVPYVIAIIELAEGVRLMSNIMNCSPDSVYIGMQVQPFFELVINGLGVYKFMPLV